VQESALGSGPPFHHSDELIPNTTCFTIPSCRYTVLSLPSLVLLPRLRLEDVARRFGSPHDCAIYALFYWAANTLTPAVTVVNGALPETLV
jgi:hypothetical protein